MDPIRHPRDILRPRSDALSREARCAIRLGCLLALAAIGCRKSNPEPVRRVQGAASEAACGQMFDATAGCEEPLAPPEELARRRARYVSVCMASLSLPGVLLTGEQLETCATAVRARATCRIGDLPECDFPVGGALKAGARCSEDGQCESGKCSGAPACGVCTAAGAAGAIARGDLGAACGDRSHACKRGLFCSGQTSRCEAGHSLGQRCSETDHCAVPFECVGDPGTCQARGAAGAPCTTFAHCGPGLVCSRATSRCVQPTWVGAEEPCGDGRVCLVGTCPGAGGKCPLVIADGQPCFRDRPSTTCDAFASCVNGACARAGAVTCP